MAEKELTREQKREKLKKELANFKLPHTGIKHAMPNVVKFKWRNKDVDLRTASELLCRTIAEDPTCKVLEFTTQEKKKLSDSGDSK